MKKYEGRFDEISGLFSLMEPMPGAIDAIHRIQKDGRFELYILSTAPWNNSSAWSDKLLWVQKYLDDVFHKRIIITHCKNLLKGDYLIDDRGKDGFGMSDDEEVEIYGFIDREGKVVSKFRHIHGNWDLLKQMQAEAEAAVKARGGSK